MSRFPGLDRFRGLHPSYRLGVASGLLFAILFLGRVTLLYSPPSKVDVVGTRVLSLIPDTHSEWLSLALLGVITGAALAALAYRVNLRDPVDLRVYLSVPGTVLLVSGLCIIAVPFIMFSVGFASGISRSLSWALSEGLTIAIFSFLLAAIGGIYLTAIAIGIVVVTILPTYAIILCFARLWDNSRFQM